MAKKRIWNDEDIKKIIYLYNEEKLSIQKIGKDIFHCRPTTISKILKENNIKLRKPSDRRKFNEEEQKRIIFLYKEKNLSQKELSRKFNASEQTIHKILIDNDIKISKRPIININQKDEYFDIIDSEEKAYFLGFIFADGNIYKNTLSIEIHEKDRELLERFKKELNLNSKIGYRKRKSTEVCVIRIASFHLVESLKKYGIIPNKTEMTKHLPDIPKNFTKDFLRGLIDGDGWISIDKNGNYHIGFVSRYQSTCEDFKKLCNSILQNKAIAKVTTKGTNCYCFQIQSQKVAKQLANALYKDNKICLSRKYKLVEPILDFKNDEDIV